MTRFRITALPADDGDCLVLSYGPAAGLKHVVIDAGRKGTANRLAAYIAAEGITRLELLVVTHVDADHIEGMLDFLDDHPTLDIGDIWFNGYKHLLEGLDVLGAPQGEKLTARIKNRPWNVAFGGKAARVADDGAPVRMPPLAGGMTFTILSPNRAKLAKLEPVWVRELDASWLHGVSLGPGVCIGP